MIHRIGTALLFLSSVIGPLFSHNQTTLVPNGSFELVEVIPQNASTFRPEGWWNPNSLVDGYDGRVTEAIRSGAIDRDQRGVYPTPDHLHARGKKKGRPWHKQYGLRGAAPLPRKHTFLRGKGRYPFRGSRDGEALVGLYESYPVIGAGDQIYAGREYISCELNEALVPGQFYKITVWALRPAGRKQKAGLQSVSGFGALLSEEKPSQAEAKPLDTPGQRLLFTPKSLSFFQTEWTPLTIVFQADAPSKYLTIGNLLAASDQTPWRYADERNRCKRCQYAAYLALDEVTMVPLAAEGVDSLVYNGPVDERVQQPARFLFEKEWLTPDPMGAPATRVLGRRIHRVMLVEMEARTIDLRLRSPKSLRVSLVLEDKVVASHLTVGTENGEPIALTFPEKEEEGLAKALMSGTPLSLGFFIHEASGAGPIKLDFSLQDKNGTESEMGQIVADGHAFYQLRLVHVPVGTKLRKKATKRATGEKYPLVLPEQQQQAPYAH